MAAPRLTNLAMLAVGLLTLSLAATPARATGPITTDTPAAEGRRLWLKWNCYGCHGMHAAGAIAVNVQGRGALVPYATHGGFASDGMPNFSTHLTGTDISNLQSYLAVAGTGNEPTFLQWWAKNPKN